MQHVKRMWLHGTHARSRPRRSAVHLPLTRVAAQGWFEGEALAAETAAMFARQCAAGDALWGDLGLCGADGSPGSSGGHGADLSGRAGVRLAESDDDESAAAAAALRPRNGYDTLAGAGRDFLAALARREFFPYIDFTEKEPCYGPSCRAPWLDFIAALPLLVGVLAPLAAVYGWRRYRIRSTRRLMLMNELAGLPGRVAVHAVHDWQYGIMGTALGDSETLRLRWPPSEARGAPELRWGLPAREL
jgi:hypothetical protein